MVEMYKKLDKALNLIASETIARPMQKRLFIKGMETVKVGKIVVISPGTRVLNSEIGDNVNIGINAEPMPPPASTRNRGPALFTAPT